MKGDVVKVEKGSLKVSTEKGSIRAHKPEECPLQNPQTAGGVEVPRPAVPTPQCSLKANAVCPAGCVMCSTTHFVSLACRLCQWACSDHCSPTYLQDMTTLSYLNEPGVLWNLKARYQLDGIYTYTGSILIAVNPFASLPLLYGQHMMQQYKGRPLGELSPHVYAIADAAFKQMRKDNKSQSILVCTVLPAAGSQQLAAMPSNPALLLHSITKAADWQHL